jgi:hypothetical protein
VKLKTHHHLVPTLRIRGSVPPLHICVHVVDSRRENSSVFVKTYVANIVALGYHIACKPNYNYLKVCFLKYLPYAKIIDIKYVFVNGLYILY